MSAVVPKSEECRPLYQPRKSLFTSGRVTGALILLGVVLVWLLPVQNIPPFCTMKRVFGIGCPTCGMTRALHFLLLGDIHKSLRYHPLLIPFLLTMVSYHAGQWNRKRLGRPGFSARTQWILGGGVLTVLIAVWIYRLSIHAVP